jgi:hypothetical protein
MSRGWLPDEDEEPVRKSRFTAEQVIKTLREADRSPAARIDLLTVRPPTL